MRHACLAIIFMATAHQISDVDGGGGLGSIGRQQHAQAIAQSVFSDALNLSDCF